MSIYKNKQKKNIEIEKKDTFHLNFNKGPEVHISGNSNKKYLVQFTENNEVLSDRVITPGMWTKCHFQYFKQWKIKIMDTDSWEYVYEQDIDLEDKEVVIEMRSSSLGDTIAWFPYLNEFQKKHKCQLTVCTFHNSLFKDMYKNMTFLEPGEAVNNVYAWFLVGWHYSGNFTSNTDSLDRFMHPKDPRLNPLQRTASDILGLDFKEIKPRISYSLMSHPLQGKKYVCIANHSTAQCKYWNNNTGWQEVVDYLKEMGYKVILLSKEPNGYMGNFNPEGVDIPISYDIEIIKNYIHHCDFFIGIGSGLSWLAWAMNKKVCLISGFSEKYTEMQEGDDVIRIGYPEGTVGGYFNKFRLNPGDWEWYPYPELKGTDREWEESKLIKGSEVIKRLKKWTESTPKKKNKTVENASF